MIIQRQLNLVDNFIDGAHANELRDIVVTALELRERNVRDLAPICALQRRIDELCSQVALPGAGTGRNYLPRDVAIYEPGSRQPALAPPTVSCSEDALLDSNPS